MYIKVRVKASAKKEDFIKKGEAEFLISVKEPAKQNLANRRVCELVADHFGVLSKEVRIISGYHHPIKILNIRD
jgi:uncharacterized protein YggU (UPF0235/DUF167 family)